MIFATQGMTNEEAVQHQYIILDKELKNIVQSEALKLGVLPMLWFVLEIFEQIEINRIKEMITMGFLAKDPKHVEKQKVGKKNLPSYMGDS